MDNIKDYNGAGQTACGQQTINGYVCSTCGTFVVYGAYHSCVYFRYPYYPPSPPPVTYSYCGPIYAQFNEILEELRVVKEQLAFINLKVHSR